MSDPTEAELLELLVADARAKSERERIPDDWEETLAKVRAEHVERPQSGPRTYARPFRLPRIYRVRLDLGEV